MNTDMHTVQQHIASTEPGTVVVEAEVLRNNRHYRVVGICMYITETEVRIAHNAKNDVVIDATNIPIKEIVTIRVVPTTEIVILE
jgi:hypothetical protein